MPRLSRRAAAARALVAASAMVCRCTCRRSRPRQLATRRIPLHVPCGGALAVGAACGRRGWRPSRLAPSRLAPSLLAWPLPAPPLPAPPLQARMQLRRGPLSVVRLLVRWPARHRCPWRLSSWAMLRCACGDERRVARSRARADWLRVTRAASPPLADGLGGERGVRARERPPQRRAHRAQTTSAGQRLRCVRPDASAAARPRRRPSGMAAELSAGHPSSPRCLGS